MEGGENRDVNQYKYRTKYSCDEYGFDMDEFDGKGVVEYSMGGWNEYDEDTLKFVKKVCLYYCQAISDDYSVEDFEMPERYLELVNKGVAK